MCVMTENSIRAVLRIPLSIPAKYYVSRNHGRELYLTGYNIALKPLYVVRVKPKDAYAQKDSAYNNLYQRPC